MNIKFEKYAWIRLSVFIFSINKVNIFKIFDRFFSTISNVNQIVSPTFFKIVKTKIQKSKDIEFEKYDCNVSVIKKYFCDMIFQWAYI